MKYLAIYYSAMNLIALLFYGVDKKRAIREEWRIPESTLLILAAMGGGLGAILGMRLFHHKTRKWKFRILVPLFFIAHIALIVWILHLV